MNNIVIYDSTVSNQNSNTNIICLFVFVFYWYEHDIISVTIIKKYIWNL